MVALTIAVTLASKELTAARAYAYNNRIEAQVSQAFTVNQSQQSSIAPWMHPNFQPVPGDGPEGDMCRDELRKLFPSDNQIPEQIPPEIVAKLYRISLCRFSDPAADAKIDWARVIGYAIGSFAVTSIGLVLWLWTIHYRHIGWRRLSIASGGLVAMIAMILAGMARADAKEALLLVVLGATAASTGMLAIRELILWVRSGFSNPSGDA
jgi:hypothetical protein